MKHFNTVILGFSALLLAPSASACSCISSNRSFVQLAQRSELVIRGKVIEYGWYKDDKAKTRPPLMMTVEVKEVYRGVTKSNKIIVQGDNGIICRPYVNQFPVGTEWVLALSKDSWTKKGELAVSGCGEYWLKVNGSNAVGKITHGNPKAKAQAMSLPNLRKLLK
jgi:hypothetical protein